MRVSLLVSLCTIVAYLQLSCMRFFLHLFFLHFFFSSMQIIGSVACCHSNPVLDLPITIGSYPIQDDTSAQTMYPYPNAVPMPMPLPENSPDYSTNVISQQPFAAQIPDPNGFSAIPYPTAPSSLFSHQNDGICSEGNP